MSDKIYVPNQDKFKRYKNKSVANNTERQKELIATYQTGFVTKPQLAKQFKTSQREIAKITTLEDKGKLAEYTELKIRLIAMEKELNIGDAEKRAVDRIARQVEEIRGLITQGTLDNITKTKECIDFELAIKERLDIQRIFESAGKTVGLISPQVIENNVKVESNLTIDEVKKQIELEY